MKRKIPLNEKTLGKIFMYLHHRASHGNDTVAARWKQAERRFEQHHMPSDRGSVNWINKYTAHRWI